MNDEPRPFHIRIDRELTHRQVIALLEEHLAGMRAESPPECVFALDLDGLRRPEITFLTAWRPAPSDSPGSDGELKSMRTSARHLRQGAAQAILTELLAIARQRGYSRVSLESVTARRRLTRLLACTGGSGLWNAGRLRITGKTQSIGFKFGLGHTLR